MSTGSHSVARVTAVLGPTNTGKTHLAMERMLGHQTGMIGFPLRLLARENYDRIVRLKGAGTVALLTGEERIIPARPRWFVCTVESMPTNLPVDFLAIDEIQLCADPDRGHVFTDRLFHARGSAETMFMGADTIRPLLRRLVPGIEFISRPRFSRLAYTGPRKIHRLPPRSAVIAFSANEVYSLAERLRHQTGGTAVVLGALSPRTRNAQVALFQAGEVEHIVATDAIGMGLNMDIDHVAFTSLRKFDGRVPRNLEASELGQIAGRAGRHMNDGTFGTTDDLEGIDPDTVTLLEGHQFPALKRLYWRNSELDFNSVEALQRTLALPPDWAGLTRARDADDELALRALAADPDTMQRATRRDRVRLLWEVCQIPDFGKSLTEQHARLLASIYRHLTDPEGRLPADWLDGQLRRIDRIDGDIDTLIQRIANIRTWTYVSHRAEWVENAAGFQEQSRAIEDRLSDALHERLTQRFVDRRTSVLLRHRRDGTDLTPAVGEGGAVVVDGHYVGQLEGLRFKADRSDRLAGDAQQRAASAAERALGGEIARRIERIIADEDDAFTLDDAGLIRWRGEPLARLAKGPETLRPTVEPLQSDLVLPAARKTLAERLTRWITARTESTLAPLFALRAAPLTGAARGLAFQLGEALGSMPRLGADLQVDALTEADRKTLAKLGVRLGTESIFLPSLLKPAAQRWRGLLWAAAQNITLSLAPPNGRVMMTAEAGASPAYYEAIGYRALGERMIRLDMLERFAFEARTLARQGPFAPPGNLGALLGATAAEAGTILLALGFKATTNETGTTYAAIPRRDRLKKQAKAKQHAEKRNPDSPFAALKQLQSV
ncbi:MAG TPA: helicase-related protein [Magnetospirillaceae bacterium]